MKLLKAMTGGLMLATAPLLAYAADEVLASAERDMSYRYFQLGYMESDIDGTGDTGDLDGFATRGNMGFGENFFVFTEYSNQSVDGDDGFGNDVDVTLKQLVVGLGGHFGLTDNLDLVGRVGYADLTLDIDGLGIESPDENGYMVGGGLRGRIGEHVEIEGGAVYYDYDDVFDEVGAEVLARYHFNDRWAVAFEYQDVGDVTTMIAGVRLSF